MTSPTMAAALRYASLGIAVFPLRPKTKQPYGRTTGLKMASASTHLANERWAGNYQLPLNDDAENRKPVTAGPSANVAIATGAPAGFWVLDLDGPDAATWLAAKEAEHGALPETVEQLTARGRHLCFAWDDAAAADPEIRNRSALDGAPVDVRGQEGYIVAPPSVHPGDDKKGIPPGWVYRWREGHAPWERAFATAPAWLVAMVKPEPVRAPVAPAPRVRDQGRASPYGEAALDRAVGTIASAVVGTRDSTLYRSACSIGRLVAGGEIDEAYARSALEGAGAVHVPSAMTEAQLVRQVERALAFGALNPKSAPERETGYGARRRPVDGEARAAERQAGTPRSAPAFSTATDAQALWAEGVAADVGMVRTWLKLRRLPHAGPWAQTAYAALRAHASAPWNRDGDRGPALLAPLYGPGADLGQPPAALAILPLAGGPDGRGAERFTHFVGDPAGTACVLAPADLGGSLLVAIDLQDAWSLGSDAFETDDVIGVALTPTLSAFCGGALGDAYGRVNLDMPQADPARPPWTRGGLAVVYLAVRGDLRTPELKVRKFEGGTRRLRLEGEHAARFCGALAEQAWRANEIIDGDDRGPKANAVRLLRPSVGVGFHLQAGRVA